MAPTSTIDSGQTLERGDVGPGAGERQRQAPRARVDDLDSLAEGLDTQGRTRAVDRILAHHAALRSELDRVCSRVGEQAETIASLELRLAAVEKSKPDAVTEPQTPKADAGKQPDSAEQSERKRGKKSEYKGLFARLSEK